MFRAILTDRLIQLLLAIVLAANIVPARGDFLDVMRTVASIGIFLLFFMNGARLPRDEVFDGIRNWRLQGTIFFWTFGAMGLMGLALGHLFEPPLPHRLALGFIFLGVLPTTVQSATAYCNIANGNVAASVVSSAIVNIAGIAVTPALFALYASSAGVGVTSDALIRVLTILLLPFVLGQVAQRWLRPFMMRNLHLVRAGDRGVLGLAVYVALSGAVTSGLWSELSLSTFAIMIGAVVIFLAFGFGGNWLLGGRLGFGWPERVTLLFSGGQKSIALGVPLAAILFGANDAGFVLLPLLTYHLLQLILSAPMASALARDGIAA